MAIRTRVVMNPDGILKLKQAALPQIKTYGIGLAARANATTKQKQPYPDYYSAASGPSSKTPHATVFTRSNHAKNSNALHHTLIRLVGGGQ